MKRSPVNPAAQGGVTAANATSSSSSSSSSSLRSSVSTNSSPAAFPPAPDAAAHRWVDAHHSGRGASARAAGAVCGNVGSALFFVALALLCCGLPNSWEAFTADGLKGFASKSLGNSSAACKKTVPGNPHAHINMCPEILDGDAIMTTFSITLDEGRAEGHARIVLKVFPDIWIFYGALLLVLAASCLAQEVDAVHYAVHRPVRCLRGNTIAQAGVALVLFVAVAFWLVYWIHDHNWHETWPVGQKETLEVASRTAGQLGLFFLGMLLFPVSRSSMWTKLCGIAWDRALKVRV